MRHLLPLLAVLALAAPAAAQTPQERAAAQDAEALRQFPPSGRLVDVGGRRLQIFCEGEGRGPTVVIETGAIASSLYYRKAQDEIAKLARVCTYDRAGLGWSDPAPGPRSLGARAEDLHMLLGKARIRRPVILVGHSMGGLIVQLYARRYPKDVAGLVLVESSEPVFNGTPDNLKRVALNAQQMGLAATAALNGVVIPQLRVPNGPPEQAVAMRASVFRTGQDDMRAMSRLPDEAAGFGPLADLPLVVIRRGKPDPGMSPEMTAGWIEAQARNAGLSTRSVAMVAEKSGHNVHADQPELYAQAVRQVMALRKGR